MEKIKKSIPYFIYSISIFIALCSFLSVLRDVEIRYLKMLDFPRIQFFLISSIFLVFNVVFVKVNTWYNYLISDALITAMFINGYYLKNYTPLVSVMVPTADRMVTSDDRFSLLLANVKMSNRNANPLLKLIEDKNPDIILAMEINNWWDGQLKKLTHHYPFYQRTINEVAYGMVLYSKLPLKNVRVNYLNNKNVPSFNINISLSNGKHFNLHCLHPVPPTHYKNLPDNAGQKETALQQVGREIKKSKHPAIIAGDLNDVVWGNINELTNTKNLLFDVRTGRGFFNSYNAENFFMRWPLDHVYVTKEFTLNKLERLTAIGSDHFPILVELVL